MNKLYFIILMTFIIINFLKKLIFTKLIIKLIFNLAIY